MTMTEQEHADLLAAYNASQDQLAADRQALEDQTATDIATACAATCDMTTLVAELERILGLAIVDSRHRSVLDSTIKLAKLLNNVTAPVPVEPEPEV